MDVPDDPKIDLEDKGKVYKATTVEYEYIKKKGIRKYKHELQHLLPFRTKSSSRSEMPVDQSGCFSYVYFTWMTSLIWRSYKFGLKPTDAFKCSMLDSSKVNGERIADIWAEETRRVGLHNASLQRVIYRFTRTRLFISSLFYLLCLITGYLSATLFLKKVLDCIEIEDVSLNDGLYWTLAMFLCEIARATMFAIMYAVTIRTSIRCSSAMSNLIYNKLLTTRSLTNKTMGELVNLFSNDVFKIFHLIYILPLTFGGPLVAIFTILYTWWLLGIFALVGVVVFAVIFILQFLIAKAQSYYRKKAISATDERISLMTEILTYIKLIKLYAWESSFTATITDLRKKERKLLEMCQYMQCFITSLSLMCPMITTIATILAYTLSQHGDLTAAKAFTLVMVNYVAAHGIRTIPIYVRDVINGKIAIKRIEKILQYDDKENYLTFLTDKGNMIEMKNATLAWESYIGTKQKVEKVVEPVQRSSTINSTCLFDINLEVEPGKLIGITGTVGSGKSALLKAILGQMRLVNGKVAVRDGLTAYVPQEPWILNATVRENIVFGYEFNAKLFYEAINCCCLGYDLKNFPEEDETEIGDRGITLSGGQKQRISLARAFYADRDIYLLDDPLASVDRSVGKYIFQNCIQNALKEKTVFLVTHQVEYLEAMDRVIFMKDGKIAKQGKHKDLMNDDYEYKQLMETSKLSFSPKEEIENNINQKRDLNEIRFSSPDWSDVKPLDISGGRNAGDRRSDSSSSDIIEFDKNDIKMSDCVKIDVLMSEVKDEKIETGNISFDTFSAYIKAGGGYFICTLVIFWLAFQAVTSSFSNWWLGYWISEGSGDESVIGNNAFMMSQMGNSSVQNSSVLNGRQDAPEWHSGHDIILNNPHIKYYQSIYALTIAVVVGSSIGVGYLFTKVTLSASSHLHDSVFSKIICSPMKFFDSVPIGRILNIFSHHMDEIDTHVPVALDGFLQRSLIVVCNLVIIILIFPWFAIPFSVLAVVFWLIHQMFRGAMRDLKRIENARRSPIYSHITTTVEGLSVIKSFNKQNEFARKFSQLVDNQSAPNFLYYCSMRWLSTRMDLLCCFISLIAAVFAISQKENVGAAFAGLALVLSMQMSGLFQYVVRLGVDTETRFTSVEKIQMNIETLKPETDLPPARRATPPDDWPTKGRISFREVTMSYRTGLPLALKGLTFDISPQEKVGIVGRTGAGKSSIASVLFRLVEINSGSIHVDGIDISSISLENLRARISIIPQDPVLFRGSIRKNLDPLNQYKLQQLIDALQSVHMKEKVNSLKEGINNSGSSFSVGERQLLCMARALLRKCKIVVMDEATSSMDSETEQLIHETVMNVFKNCTVIKIAHRLQTIQACDRVMVLKDGNIVEFDKPSSLFSNPNSYFSQLISNFSLKIS